MLYRILSVVALLSTLPFSVACGPAKADPALASQSSASPTAAAPKGALKSRGDTAQLEPACQACRQAHCTNYEGLLNLVSTCFENADPEFSALCTAAKDCATRAGCGYAPLGSAECFCGTADLGACQTEGAANGPCKKEFYAASRSKSLPEVAAHFGDLTYPSGVAHYLHACDRDYCAKECKVGSANRAPR